jgi:predicted PurR-regulated permease PerM
MKTAADSLFPPARVALVITAAGLLAALHLGLLPALFAALAAFRIRVRVAAALQRVAAPARGRQALVLGLSALVLALLVVGVLEAYELLAANSPASLQRLIHLLADTVQHLRSSAPPWLTDRVPASAEALQAAIAGWLRGHAAVLQGWGRAAARTLVYVLVGLVIGFLAAGDAARDGEGDGDGDSGAAAAGPLAHALRRNLHHLARAFGQVFSAQIWIAALNAGLTLVYLQLVLPALGYHVPFATTLVLLTFVLDLLPIVGNVASNAAVVIASLTVSFPIAEASLLFLVLVHKLEYFLNARFVGAMTRVKTYTLLAFMLVLEAAFGLPGLVAAPLYCAWLAGALRGAALAQAPAGGPLPPSP